MATGKPENEIQLKDVYDAIFKARAKWRQIGIQLGLTLGDLEAYSKKHQDPDDLIASVLDWWLRNSENPTWSVLVDVLCSKSVGHTKLALTISNKYCDQGVHTTVEDIHPISALLT